MHYTKSQKAVDAAINEIPSILNYRPALIWDKACILASYLGSPDPTIVFEK